MHAQYEKCDSKHNSKIMEDSIPANSKTCSYQQKSDCPLNQSCLSESLVYNAVANTSTTNITTELVKIVSKRDITIPHHHLEVNYVRKVQNFLTTYGN